MSLVGVGHVEMSDDFFGLTGIVVGFQLLHQLVISMVLLGMGG